MEGIDSQEYHHDHKMSEKLDESPAQSKAQNVSSTFPLERERMKQREMTNKEGQFDNPFFIFREENKFANKNKLQKAYQDLPDEQKNVYRDKARCYKIVKRAKELFQKEEFIEDDVRDARWKLLSIPEKKVFTDKSELELQRNEKRNRRRMETYYRKKERKAALKAKSNDLLVKSDAVSESENFSEKQPTRTSSSVLPANEPKKFYTKEEFEAKMLEDDAKVVENAKTVETVFHGLITAKTDIILKIVTSGTTPGSTEPRDEEKEMREHVFSLLKKKIYVSQLKKVINDITPMALNLVKEAEDALKKIGFEGEESTK